MKIATGQIRSYPEEKAIHVIEVGKKFPTDPALFQIEDIHYNIDLRKELCRLGPCQPNEDDLEHGFLTTEDSEKTKRSFHQTWYFKCQAKNDADCNLQK